nr:MAG TPA: hypothetical protein [Caudoviricetes sp.]
MFYINESGELDSLIDNLCQALDELEEKYQFIFKTKDELMDILKDVDSLLLISGLKLDNFDVNDFLDSDITNEKSEEPISVEFPVYNIFDSEFADPTDLVLSFVFWNPVKETEKIGTFFRFDFVFIGENDDEDEEVEDLSDEPFAQVNRPYDLIPGVE